MLNPLELTPVHGDFGRVQGVCAGRGGGSTLQQRAVQAPHPAPSPASASPLLPTERWTLLGGPVPF